jgi:hypothetical protein
MLCSSLRQRIALRLQFPHYANANGRVLERLLEPVAELLNEEAARKLLRLKADAKAQVRVGTLARKCNERKLSPEERAEYEAYVVAGDVIAILRAKAQLMLARRGRPA